jgi:Zn(2)-Cys(6) binuclear cluster domain-containing protein
MADTNDGYFSRLPMQPLARETSESRTVASNNASGATSGSTTGGVDDGNYVPRPKRIACVVCRKRKLRCDGRKPSCGTCTRLGHNCAYDEVRKKSGPKRGYVKQLEARLGMIRHFSAVFLGSRFIYY